MICSGDFNHRLVTVNGHFVIKRRILQLKHITSVDYKPKRLVQVSDMCLKDLRHMKFCRTVTWGCGFPESVSRR